MNGHEDIIRLRRERMAPSFVFINDYPCETDWLSQRAHCTICTHGDSIPALDLRFLVGLKVSISSTTEARAKALFEACKTAGAAVVAACHVTNGKQDGWTQVWRKA